MNLMKSWALAALITAQAGLPALAETPVSPQTRDLAGAYLAARMAAMNNDYAIAADYYLRALKQDPGESYLTDSALVALISAGEVERAHQLILDQGAKTERTGLEGLVNRAVLAKNQDWDGLIALGAIENDSDTGVLLDGMVQAWALLGVGRASEALERFDTLAKLPGAGVMINYHIALAKAKVGDFEGALAVLDQGPRDMHLPALIARVQILAQLDRRDDALKVLDGLDNIEIEPQLVALRAKLQSDETIAFDVIDGPRDGIAQVYLTFATALGSSEEPSALALIHARLASFIAPNMTDARLLAAQFLQGFGQFDAAEAEFNAVRDKGQMRPAAELARIDALTRARRLEDATQAAMALTATYPDLASAWISLGDLLREQDRFGQAIPAYDKALALIPKDRAQLRWFPLYAGGIAKERNGAFAAAEKDFKAALEIRPDDASLLNYLGYSYVDRGEKLDEALTMIQKAAELSPDDGYILDSLGWAYYRLGRYEEAVAPMEAAVGTMSNDSLVNDHLGDVYAKVGRQREAEIQWKRALSHGPETEAEADRIRAKLERGLEAVLAQEAENGGKLPKPKPDRDTPK